MKKILISILSVLALSAAILAHAVTWQDLGQGMYLDFDSISNSGNQMSVVMKTINKDMVGGFAIF